MKKIIIVSFLIIALLVIAGGGFLWWQANQAVAGLNKSLPSGVRVAKSLFGSDYTVVNKIDGYEFKVPRSWEGIEEIEYTPKNTVEGYIATSLYLVGLKGQGRVISLDLYELDDKNEELRVWTEELFRVFDLSGDLEEVIVNNMNFLKTIEEKHLGGTYIYLTKTIKGIYVFNGGSEEFIKEIILSGKW